MSKLDVGVGDEFPAREASSDNAAVHHYHHYHRHPRGRLLRLLLTVALIILIVRAFHYAWGPPLWPRHDFSPYAIFPLGGLAGLILVVGLVLWFTRCRPEGGR